MENRVTLLEQFRNALTGYANRDLTHARNIEYVIFIPLESIKEDKGETDKFIEFSRLVKDTEEWNCPVNMIPTTEGAVKGIEMVFIFNQETKYSDIINKLETYL